jgi:hypothetical protein
MFCKLDYPELGFIVLFAPFRFSCLSLLLRLPKIRQLQIQAALSMCPLQCSGTLGSRRWTGTLKNLVRTDA